MDRPLNPEFGSRQPIHVMIQVARGGPAVMMVQPSLHGHMVLVHGIEMLGPATQFAPAEANRFQAKIQSPACRLIAIEVCINNVLSQMQGKRTVANE